MNKKESVEFLKKCLQQLDNASEEELENIRRAFEIESERTLESEIEFIAPGDVEKYGNHSSLYFDISDVLEANVKKNIQYNTSNNICSNNKVAVAA